MAMHKRQRRVVRRANAKECAPESQTLIVLSQLPDTILLPSGENCTEVMRLLWATVFSVFSSSVAALGSRNGQFRLKLGRLRKAST